MTPEIMVLGGSGVGKTHLVGQLVLRMRRNRQGLLRIRHGGVQNLSSLEEVLTCLEAGRAAGHTPAETWTGVKCELETVSGQSVSLEWPEYAGERLFSIVKRRAVPEEWRKSISSATGWLLFIRPSTLNLYEDLLTRPAGVTPPNALRKQSELDGNSWDDRARYVELLQILLCTAGKSSYSRIDSPRLAIVLSCWDEGTNSKSPVELFNERMPLLSSFVRSNWVGDAWSVWGLSSLGRALSQEQCDQDYAEKGPENFGYVVETHTTKMDTDLTRPIAWLMKV